MPTYVLFAVAVCSMAQSASSFTTTTSLIPPALRTVAPLLVSPSIDPFSDHALAGHCLRPTIQPDPEHVNPLEAATRKVTMMLFVAAMCVALPLSLFPLLLAHKCNMGERTKREALALEIGESCTRCLLAMLPFAKINVQSDVNHKEPPEPSIWVCNHTSMLDTFVLLASDRRLRGPKKRPIKVIYWKGLEANPVTNLLFQLAGFIPVDMAANGSGVPNEYDKASFLGLLRKTKKAMQEGFDILVLPEGQLNPWPEQGVLQVFPGAQKLSKISQRPIQMIALHGANRFWHADEAIGMKVTGREIRARAYGKPCIFPSDEDFVETFRTVVGYFGAKGIDLPPQELQAWLEGGSGSQSTEERSNE